MAEPSTRDPFDVLKDIERRSRKCAVGLPQQVQVQRFWVGIGYRLGESRLVTPIGEVTEMFRFPRLTQVPGVKPWVKGIANIRGSLLPIIDLRGCLGGGYAVLSRRSRVLTMQHHDLISGFLVDEVLGLKHFFQEELSSELGELEPFLSKYAQGSFSQDDVHWGVLSIHKLAADPDFLQAAR